MVDWNVLRRELAVARIKAGLEEETLAKAITVAKSTIYRIEKSTSGKNNPSLDVIEKWVNRCGLSLSAFTLLVEEESAKATRGEPKQFSVLKSAPEQPQTVVRQENPIESSARPMPSSADEHGQARAVPGEFAAALTAMREATDILTRAIDYTSAIGGTQVAKRSRQAAKARAARARKREQSRKDRRKGPGAA